MKFNEFKKLIEERQELVLEKERSVEINKEINSKISEIEQKIFNQDGYSNIKLYKLFYVGTEEVQNSLERYFADKEKIEIGFSGINLEFHLVVDNMLYRLGTYDTNQTLKCLYCGSTNSDWELLLTHYPDLKEFLWQEYKNLKTVTKRTEMSLLQKRWNKRNEELEFLLNPESVQERIRELKTETKKMESQIEKIAETLEDLNFD